MSWLQRLSQRYEDTNYWGRSFRESNPDAVGGFEVYQSPDFPHVFLGGKDDEEDEEGAAWADLEEASQKAGQPICKIVDCRDLPEIGAENPSWDYAFYATVKAKFDKKVAYLAETIQTTDCPIFVHCSAGANRSVSVLAAAISLLTNQPIDTILADMRQKRMVVRPQDPYYLMALEESPAESEGFKEQRYLELDQDFPLVQPDLPEVEPFSSRLRAQTSFSSWLIRVAQEDEDRVWSYEDYTKNRSSLGNSYEGIGHTSPNTSIWKIDSNFQIHAITPDAEKVPYDDRHHGLLDDPQLDITEQDSMAHGRVDMDARLGSINLMDNDLQLPNVDAQMRIFDILISNYPGIKFFVWASQSVQRIPLQKYVESIS